MFFKDRRHPDSLRLSYLSSLCTLKDLTNRIGVTSFTHMDLIFLLSNPANFAEEDKCQLLRKYKKKCRFFKGNVRNPHLIHFYNGSKSEIFTQLENVR